MWLSADDKSPCLLTSSTFICLFNFVLQLQPHGVIEELILLMLTNILFADFEEPRSKLPVGYSS